MFDAGLTSIQCSKSPPKVARCPTSPSLQPPTRPPACSACCTIANMPPLSPAGQTKAMVGEGCSLAFDRDCAKSRTIVQKHGLCRWVDKWTHHKLASGEWLQPTIPHWSMSSRELTRRNQHLVDIIRSWAQSPAATATAVAPKTDLAVY